MDINHNQVVYIPKGEHDNPHELPRQQELEGSKEIEHTLYSHIDTISSETNSFQKLVLNDVLNSDTIPESKSKITQPMEIHSLEQGHLRTLHPFLCA